VRGSAKISRSSATLVSTTTGRGGSPGAAWAGRRSSTFTFALGSAFGGALAGTLAQRSLDHVEAEHAAFDGAVPHRHAARFLQAHLAGQLEVGREHPGRPAAVVLLPVRGELAEELAAVLGLRRLAARALDLAPAFAGAAPGAAGGGNALA